MDISKQPSYDFLTQPRHTKTRSRRADSGLPSVRHSFASNTSNDQVNTRSRRAYSDTTLPTSVEFPLERPRVNTLRQSDASTRSPTSFYSAKGQLSRGSRASTSSLPSVRHSFASNVSTETASSSTMTPRFSEGSVDDTVVTPTTRRKYIRKEAARKKKKALFDDYLQLVENMSEVDYSAALLGREELAAEVDIPAKRLFEGLTTMDRPKMHILRSNAIMSDWITPNHDIIPFLNFCVIPYSKNPVLVDLNLMFKRIQSLYLSVSRSAYRNEHLLHFQVPRKKYTPVNVREIYAAGLKKFPHLRSFVRKYPAYNSTSSGSSFAVGTKPTLAAPIWVATTFALCLESDRRHKDLGTFITTIFNIQVYILMKHFEIELLPNLRTCSVNDPAISLQVDADCLLRTMRDFYFGSKAPRVHYKWPLEQALRHFEYDKSTFIMPFHIALLGILNLPRITLHYDQPTDRAHDGLPLEFQQYIRESVDESILHIFHYADST